MTIAAPERPIRDHTQGGVSAGDRFGSLTAIRADRRIASGGHRRWFWLCRCDCGSESWIIVGNLRTGNSESCGCEKLDRIRRAKTTHGQSHQRSTGRASTPEYNSWSAMHQRCSVPTNHKYPDYGGRGIGVCDRWLSFESFFADMGRKPSARHTIDRINNDGNYEPSNCRWATPLEQRLNQRPRRPNRTYRGGPIKGRAA